MVAPHLGGSESGGWDPRWPQGPVLAASVGVRKGEVGEAEGGWGRRTRRGGGGRRAGAQGGSALSGGLSTRVTLNTVAPARAGHGDALLEAGEEGSLGGSCPQGPGESVGGTRGRGRGLPALSPSASSPSSPSESGS